METYYVCFLTVLAVMMMIAWLVVQYRRAVRRMDKRLANIRNAHEDVLRRIHRLEGGELNGDPARVTGWSATPSLSGEKLLTVEGIAECVRSVGYEPRMGEGSIGFVKENEAYVIDAERLPRFFISKSYRVNPDKCDLELMQRAAHQMSDDVMMVKADISEGTDDEGNCELRFFLAAMDRTLGGFRQNLADYIEIIDEGQRRLGNMYNQLMEEKNDVSSLNTLADASSRQAGKTPS